ncbi:MAG TPA: hypothetical protein VLS27_17755 [Gammaproteobacteria bacterium]|nr:hypothetical protein [Gammaproteobacteria bacterium]
MAWSWLTVAAKTIPWGTIVRRAPDIIDAASGLLARQKARRTAENAAAQTETQLSEIRSRLSDLESHDQETAEVVNQIAQQTRDISIGMEVLAAKIRLLTVLFGTTLILAAIAIAVAVSG